MTTWQPMSDSLPDRRSILNWKQQLLVVERWQNGVLRSRDEMDEEAMAERIIEGFFFDLDYTSEEIAEVLLDAAWEIRDRG